MSCYQKKSTLCIVITISIILMIIGAISWIIIKIINDNSESKMTAEQAGDYPILSWWQNATVYRIFLPSFRDVDEDGVGDYLGIKEKMDYLVNLSVDVLWLSPIQDSDSGAYGIDILDFSNIKERYGYQDEFKDFMKAAKLKNIKVIMDVVITHSSIAHQWFALSKNKRDPYTDYYIWNDKRGENGEPPDDSISRYGGSAWAWEETRRAFYFHSNHESEPDLNYNNERLQGEMKDMIVVWLNQGISGFYLKDLPQLYKHPQYLNSTSNHIDIVSIFSAAIKEWQSKNNKTSERILLFECNTTSHMIGKPSQWINSDLYTLNPSFNGNDLHKAVQKIQNYTGQLSANQSSIWPFRILGDDNRSRITSKFTNLSAGLLVVHLLLPGTPIIYYGEEIKMEDYTNISFDDTRDSAAKHKGPNDYMSISSDPFRTPMQWDKSKHSGFSSAKVTWLPVHSNYKTVNVAAEINSNNSFWSAIQRLNSLRKLSLAITAGDIEFPDVSNNIFSFNRTHKQDPVGYLVIFNVGDYPKNVTHITANYNHMECMKVTSFKQEIFNCTNNKIQSVDKKEVCVISFVNLSS